MSRQPIEAPKQRRKPQAPWKYRITARRREEAEQRQAARDARGDEEQMARLDAMFGAGKGALRERERLAQRLFKGFGEKAA